ncbi:MAG: hypothetical protein AAB519_02945 [Patescibacteria group bacterium]
MLGLLLPSKKRVTPKEFKESVRSDLQKGGLTHRDIERVSEVADASLNERGTNYGMDRHEKDQLLDTLRKNHASNGLSDHDLDTLDKTLSGKL